MWVTGIRTVTHARARVHARTCVMITTNLRLISFYSGCYWSRAGVSACCGGDGAAVALYRVRVQHDRAAECESACMIRVINAVKSNGQL